MVVDVVAHFLNKLWDQVRANRFVLTTFYCHASGPIISSIGTYPRERFSLQPEDQRRPKFERAAIQSAVDSTDRRIILPKAVSSFDRSPLLRIGN